MTNSLIALYRAQQEAALAVQHNAEMGSRLREILVEATESLQGACTHSKVSLTRTGTRGGYDHTSTSTDIRTCDDCGKAVSTVPTPGYRGSYA